MLCNNCGNNILESDKFCNKCGSKVEMNDQPQQTFDDVKKEFMDTTYRLLKWERMAWSIAGKVYLILGIVLSVIYFILAIAYLFIDSLAVFSIIFFIYSIILGGLIIGIGIVNKVMADKIAFYQETLYTQPQFTFTRCSSVGMLVVSAIFGTVSPIFFIINFVRMKSSKHIIDSILYR